jgi:hypothetical protein
VILNDSICQQKNSFRYLLFKLQFLIFNFVLIEFMIWGGERGRDGGGGERKDKVMEQKIINVS